MLQCHPDVKENIFNVPLRDAWGRLNKKTPVTDVRTMVEIVLLLPGRQAAAVRREKARDYAQHNLIPYFLACGAHVEGLSRNAGQPAQVDKPEQSLDNPRQRCDEYMGLPIEAYEREIATQSRGLVRGRCAWCHGKETWLVDLPLVILVINRLRTPQARRFQAASLEQSLLIMSGREDVARSLANYWRQERMQRPDNVLLAFTGAAVDHELPSAAPGAMQPAQRPPMDAGNLAQDVLALAVPQLCATIQRQFDERFDALAARLQAQRGDNIVNLNVRSPKRPLQQVGPGPPLAVAANDGGPPLPAAKFLDQKERQDPRWANTREFHADFYERRHGAA